MNRLFNLILIIAGIVSMNSCKDLSTEEGDLLLDVNDNTGLIGPRALSREVTDDGTIAQYFYNGLLLNKVITEKASITDIEYSGDKISRLTFRGHLDLDGDGTIDDDSVTYTQQYTYGNLGRLTIISENRSVFTRTPAVPPTTPPGPYTLAAKTKSIYNLTYSPTSGKLATIVMKNGPDVTPFEYINYTKATYTYLGDNVSSVDKEIGILTGNTMEPPVQVYNFGFTNYDSQINGYTLLPFEYKVSVLIATDVNDGRSLILSPNNPRRTSVTDMSQVIPVTVDFSTNYRYDAQTYMTQGFDVNYIYKPL